jgi:hypothetical protein
MLFWLFMIRVVGVNCAKFMVWYCEVPVVKIRVARFRARRGRARCTFSCS